MGKDIEEENKTVNESHKGLFERIREKCRQQGWYGPDRYNPFRFLEQQCKQPARERENSSAFIPGFPSFRTRGTLRNYYKISENTDLSSFPLQTDFEYPPATEEQLVNSEEALGYTLPSLLRELYTTVANGGFGPGYGLNGVMNGFGSAVEDNFHRDIPSIHPQDDLDEKVFVRQLDLWAFGSLDYREIAFSAWPLKGLFTLCHWGCGICSYLDCSSGRLFRGEVGYDAYILRCEATSLDEWLDLWSKGEDLWSRMDLKEKARE